MDIAIVHFYLLRFICICVIGFGILNFVYLIYIKAKHETFPSIWEIGFTRCVAIFAPAVIQGETDFEKALYERNKSYLFAACLCWIIYVILYLILTYRKGMVRRMLNLLVKFVDCTFNLVESLRAWIEQRRFAGHPLLSGLAIAIAMATSFASIAYPQSQTLLNCIAVLAILWFFAMELCENIFSCRGLLKFWLGYGFVSALLICALAEQIWKQNNSIILYCVFILCYILLWVLTALLGDDAAAKMALSIVNTITTICTVVFNIVLIIFAQLVDAQIMQTNHVAVSSYNTIAITANMVLLPFFAAGFLAALGKEMQIYWRTKWHTNKDKILIQSKEYATTKSETSEMH